MYSTISESHLKGVYIYISHGRLYHRNALQLMYRLIWRTVSALANVYEYTSRTFILFLTRNDEPPNDSLQWHHNGCHSVPNHQPHHCLLNRLFGRRSKKTSKIRVTGLCAGNSPRTGEFPTQRASNAENASIWWRHHVWKSFVGTHSLCLRSYDDVTTDWEMGA